MSIARRVVQVLWIGSLLMGCNANKEKECVDPPTKSASLKKDEDGAGKNSATVAKTATVAKKDADWCRACVVGPHGYMSCQRKTATNPAETHEQLRERARLAACTDAGFAADKCPKEKVIGLVCKGDPEPKDKREAGTKLLNALKNSGPLVLTKDKEAMERLQKKMKQKNPSSPEPSASSAGDAEKTASETPKE